MIEPSNDQRNERSDLTGEGEDLHAQSIFAARGGRYAEAVQLLDAARAARQCTPVEALDLHARICAQQGLHLEAERLWLRATELSGNPTAFDAPLRRLRDLRIRPSRLPVVLVAASVLLIMGTVVWRGDARVTRHVRSSFEALREEIERQGGVSSDSTEVLGTRLKALSDQISERERRQTRRLDSFRVEADLRSGEVGARVAGLEDAILLRLRTYVAATENRMDSFEQRIIENVSGLAKADQVESLRRVTAALREQISGMARLVEELRERGRTAPTDLPCEDR